jgi:hypothetical protein
MHFDKIPEQAKDRLCTIVVTGTDARNKTRKTVNESMKNNLPPDKTCANMILVKLDVTQRDIPC